MQTYIRRRQVMTSSGILPLPRRPSRTCCLSHSYPSADRRWRRCHLSVVSPNSRESMYSGCTGSENTNRTRRRQYTSMSCHPSRLFHHISRLSFWRTCGCRICIYSLTAKHRGVSLASRSLNADYHRLHPYERSHPSHISICMHRLSRNTLSSQ